MIKPQIRGIVWDFGNVLAQFDHFKACKKLAQYSDMSPNDIFRILFSRDDTIEKLHEVGKLSPQEFFLAVRKVVHLTKNLYFKEFCSIWRDILQENKGIETIIDRVRRDVKQCILSNTDPIHWSAIEQLSVMKKHFSNQRILVRSYTFGTRKPDAKIYQEALKCLGFGEKEAKYILYIEDIAKYRDAFKDMGGNVLSYDCSKDTIAQLKVNLIKFDVLYKQY